MAKLRELGEYISIGTGMALACSSFMVIGGALNFVSGSWLLAAILIGGLLTLLIALTVAEWASLLPGGAGISAYLKSAFGERTSLFFMFLYLSLIGCLAGVESFVFSELMEKLFPGTFPALPSALAVLFVIIAVNLTGFEFSRNVQTVTTALLAAGMLALAAWVFRLTYARPDAALLEPLRWTPGTAGRLCSAVGASIFLFVGFEWVAPLGQSPKAYRWLIPASMVLSVILLIVLYGAFSWALVAGPGSAAARGSAVPQFVLAAWALGAPARYVAAALSLLAMATSFNAGMLGAGRMIYALARQKRLPAAFAKLSERNGNPVNAVLLAGGLACVSATLIILFRIPLVASSLAACIECAVYAALLAGLLKFRRGNPVNRGGFRSPVPAALQVVLAAALPVLGVAALFVDAQSGPIALCVLAVLTAGAWCYSKYAAPRSKPAVHPGAAVGNVAGTIALSASGALAGEVAGAPNAARSEISLPASTHS
jgi:amino acid transporter